VQKKDTSYESQGCFDWKKTKTFLFLEKKKSKWPIKKKLILQLRQFSFFFVKISWICPLDSRIDWCEGHWCGSTYIVVP
jgi:hypothetical protein